MNWIKTSERWWTEDDRERGIWVWEGNCPLWNHRPDEKPRRLPRHGEDYGDMLKDYSGAYASHWMPATDDIPPEPPHPPSPLLDEKQAAEIYAAVKRTI